MKVVSVSANNFGITMILKCLVVLCCAAACLGNDYRSYYAPPQSQPIIHQYNDGNNYGHSKHLEYDHNGHRQIQNIHDSHGARDYGAGENHALRDFAQQAHHNQGAHATVHSSGGEQNHVRKSHDKGFYEREKKYGYEKAYGYERETKSHDKDSKAISHGSGYNHHENKGHYNHGAQAIRDHASQGNKHKYGSDSHGNRHVLIDLSGEQNRGKDIVSQYNKLRNFNILRPEHLRTYLPMFLKKDYVDNIDGTLARFQYLSGIHGLGGLRAYGLGYGYNPLRYGLGYKYNTLKYGIDPLKYRINSFDIGDQDGHELTYLDYEPVENPEPLDHEILENIEPFDHEILEEPRSKVYFIKHGV